MRSSSNTRLYASADPKKAKAVLHESNEVFRLAMNNIAAGVYTLDQQGMVTYVNPAAERMFGWTSAELLGKKMHDVTHYKHPDGSPYPANECPCLQILGKGIELREHEDVFVRKDGSFLPVVFSASPLIKNGLTVGIVVGFRDDALRREAERAVRESEERFRLVANAAPVMIWMSHIDKRCTYFNQGWLEFTGRSLDEEIGDGWAEGVHPEDLARCLDTYTNAFDRREAFQMDYRLRRHDGEYRWICDSGVPRFNVDGAFAGYIGSCIDVSERRRMDEALRESEERFRTAFEEGPVGLALVARDHRFVKVNRAFCKLMEYSEASLLQMKVADITYQDDLRADAELAERLFRREIPFYTLEKRYVKKTGEIIWTNLHRSLIPGPEGEPLHVLAMVQDITERKRAEEALRRSEARWNAATENLGSGIVIATETEQVIYRNPAARVMHGFTSDQAGTGSLQEMTNIFELWTPDGRLLTLDEWPFRRIKRGETLKHLELRLCRPDQGWEKFVSYSGATVESSINERLLFLSVQDVTARKQAEDALRESEHRLLSIYNTVEDVIFHLAIEPEGQFRFVSVNAAFLRVTGLSQEKVVGKTVNEVIPEPSLTIALKSYRQAIEEKTVVRWEETSDYPTGRLTGEVSIAPVFTNTGTCTHLVGSVHDLTAIKLARETENQLASDLAASRDEIRSLAAGLMRAQEDERRRVSRELHDHICHQLASLARDIGTLALGTLPSEDLRAQLKAIGARAVKTSQDAHRIAYQMHAAVLDDLGLVASLKDLCIQFSERYPNISWSFEDVSSPASIPPEVATCLYRVAEESLQNKAKHSHAKVVSVRLSLKKGAVVLTIQDDGVGFNPQTVKGRGGLGLISMRERAHLVNGKLTMSSRLGHGTQTVLEVPLPAKNP